MPDYLVNGTIGTAEAYAVGYSSTAYDHARTGDGSSSKSVIDDFGTIGSRAVDANEYIDQTFAEFDTSVIPTKETVVGIRVLFVVDGDWSTNDFDIEARIYDFGDVMDAGDFISSATMASNPLLAHINTSNIGDVGTTAEMTVETGIVLPTFVNNASNNTRTRMVFGSSRVRVGYGSTDYNIYNYVAIRSVQLIVTTTVVPTMRFGFRLSGGPTNSDINASIGGVMSAINIIGGGIPNLFDSITAQEATVGDTEYRCFYIINIGSGIVYNMKLYIPVQPAAGTALAVGLETGFLNKTCLLVADENTAPGGVGVTFTAPSTSGAGISLGNMAVNDKIGIWVRRTVTPGASEQTASGVINIEGSPT
jgi:hypothetical protein